MPIGRIWALLGDGTNAMRRCLMHNTYSAAWFYSRDLQGAAAVYCGGVLVAWGNRILIQGEGKRCCSTRRWWNYEVRMGVIIHINDANYQIQNKIRRVSILPTPQIFFVAKSWHPNDYIEWGKAIEAPSNEPWENPLVYAQSCLLLKTKGLLYLSNSYVRITKMSEIY